MLQEPPLPLRLRARQALATGRRAWIPPVALIAGQAAHGLSWLVLLALAWTGNGADMPRSLAWVHLVALGWLTTVSLAVLVHVIPGVLDLEWRGQQVARGSIAPFWLGTLAMAWGFWQADFGLVAIAATVVGLSLAVYLACVAATFVRFEPSPDASVRVFRAFIGVFIALGLTAGLGVLMAYALHGDVSGTWLVGIPALHAHLGALGWLTLLVIGVSARTVRRITGAKTNGPWLHVAAATLFLAVLFPLTLGLLGLGKGWLWVAAALAVQAALAHALELSILVQRASEPHRPPRAFIAAAGLYLVLATCLGAGLTLGQADWAPAYAFLALAGWLGQMVNGHLHHIGVRLLATLARGDDDDTEPLDLLHPPLSWGAFGASQLAVALGTVALFELSPHLLIVAAVSGFIGWAMMVANMRHAWVTARAH